MLPDMKLGWVNGWLMLAAFYIVFGVLMAIFPREIMAKLYNVVGWSREQRIFSAAGKVFNLTCLVLIIFTPLKIEQGVFIAGSVVFLLGFAGMMVALFNYRNTPADQPVTQGLYHFRVLGEERACLSSYGESYQDFMARVPRYFLFF